MRERKVASEKRTQRDWWLKEKRIEAIIFLLITGGDLTLRQERYLVLMEIGSDESETSTE